MAKNHKAKTTKPGSNGNPFYCLRAISPILAAGCVKFAIKRLECITGLQHPRRYPCSFSNENAQTNSSPLTPPKLGAELEATNK